MTSLQIPSKAKPLAVNFPDALPRMTMTTAQFYEFCAVNPELRIERTAEGEVIVMPPAFSDTGNRNVKISYQVIAWAEANDMGEVFDSSAGFTLPNGATRSPDTSWIPSDRWNALSAEQQESFAPICPDFVIELRSKSDRLAPLQRKMQEYLDNGTKLGLLIDRKQRKVHVYRPGTNPKTLDDPGSVICDPELPGFQLKMRKIW